MKCIVCEQQLEPAPTKNGWMELGIGKGIHDRCLEHIMKLIQKRKHFLVVACDEPYYFGVYGEIREHEKEIGRWTAVDEYSYQLAREDYLNRPLPEAPGVRNE